MISIIAIVVMSVGSAGLGVTVGTIRGKHIGRKEGIASAMTRIGSAVRAQAAGVPLDKVDWDHPPAGMHGIPRGAELERLIGTDSVSDDIADVAALINPDYLP